MNKSNNYAIKYFQSMDELYNTIINKAKVIEDTTRYQVVLNNQFIITFSKVYLEHNTICFKLFNPFTGKYNTTFTIITYRGIWKVEGW